MAFFLIVHLLFKLLHVEDTSLEHPNSNRRGMPRRRGWDIHVSLADSSDNPETTCYFKCVPALVFFIASTSSDNPQVRQSLSGEREKEMKERKRSETKTGKNG